MSVTHMRCQVGFLRDAFAKKVSIQLVTERAMGDRILVLCNVLHSFASLLHILSPPIAVIPKLGISALSSPSRGRKGSRRSGASSAVDPRDLRHPDVVGRRAAERHRT